jgi:hypothetical protein
MRCCACMVHIKFIARPRTCIVSSEVESMASDEALETSTQQREALSEVVSSCSAESDRESRSGDFGDNESASDNSRSLKVAAVTTLAEITYNFGMSGIMKACVVLMENYTHYFG